MPGSTVIAIKPPNFERRIFRVRGITPLVVNRMSIKLKAQFTEQANSGGKQKGKKATPDTRTPEEVVNDARYRHKDGWDGFNASAIRNAMIAACRLVNMTMTLAKLTVFVEADGWDAIEPQIPLVRIYGDHVLQFDIGRTTTGDPKPTWRPAYHGWEANIQIRYDADQFKQNDIANLLARVGDQVGICEGRPFSKNSAGMDWGRFELM